MTDPTKRTEQAPHPIGLPLMQTTGMQLSAILAWNEEVEWHWQHLPNGSYVTGYTIIPRLPVIREPK